METETWYEIRELSGDGLLKHPKEDSAYGREQKMFDDEYGSMDEVDKAIDERGATYSDYVVLTMKRRAFDRC